MLCSATAPTRAPGGAHAAQRPRRPGTPLSAAAAPPQSYQYHWLVDPLDGTKEFIKRNGQFTVNIALIHQGDPVLGVVHVPCQVRPARCPWGNGAMG